MKKDKKLRIFKKSYTEISCHSELELDYDIPKNLLRKTCENFEKKLKRKLFIISMIEAFLANLKYQ